MNSLNKLGIDTIATSKSVFEQQQIAEENVIRELGGKIGYGRLMQLASQEWGKSLNSKGLPSGGNFVIGPCSATVTQCGCSGAHTGDVCDWCCGTGWLTKHVREVQKTLTGK